MFIPASTPFTSALDWAGGGLKVTIGEISAKCPGCQGDEFELVGEDGGLKHERRYRCASCHAEERYGMLLVNIGEQALERAKLARGKAPKK